MLFFRLHNCQKPSRQSCCCLRHHWPHRPLGETTGRTRPSLPSTKRMHMPPPCHTLLLPNLKPTRHFSTPLDTNRVVQSKNVMLDLDNRDNTDWAVSAEIQLIAPDGTTAHEFPAQTVTIGSGRSTQLNFSASLTGLKLWTAETPNLYSVIVALKRCQRP